MKRILLLAAVLSLATAAGAADFKRADYVSRLQTCEAILQSMQLYPSSAIPADVLHRAKGLVIVNQVQVGFLVGVKDGWGVALVRKPGGQWSLPVFIKAGELSLGLQAGGKTVETVYVLMDESATRLLFQTRFKFGMDAKAVAGPHAAEAERSTPEFNAQVLVYTNVNGFYAGATVKTGTMSPLVEATQQFYQTRYGVPEMLYSDWVQPQPEAQELMNYVQRLAQ
ncbi:MAG TPA: lipid-binding SYLF domain-containing protein [Opitutaceae bacterium]|nr:lipid-binding SYLF domain-containing protein [Opitutaceae bacterium]